MKKKLHREKCPECQRTWLALLDMFSVLDTIFIEPGAFDSEENLNKALGQTYRSWLKAREALDPEFNKGKYRYEIKERIKAQPWLPKAVRQTKKAKRERASR